MQGNSLQKDEVNNGMVSMKPFPRESAGFVMHLSSSVSQGDGGGGGCRKSRGLCKTRSHVANEGQTEHCA